AANPRENIIVAVLGILAGKHFGHDWTTALAVRLQKFCCRIGLSRAGNVSTTLSKLLKQWSITKSHKSAGFGMGWTLRALAFRRSLTYCMATTSEKRWRLTRVS